MSPVLAVVDSVARWPRGSGADLHVLPFTEDPDALAGAPDARRLPSCRWLDDAMNDLRSRAVSWSARLGRKRVAGRPLVEWFPLDDRGESAWWLSLLSEKNTLKTDVFTRVAQLQVVKRALDEHLYREVWVAVIHPELRSAVIKLARRLGRPVRLLTMGSGTGSPARRFLARIGYVGDLAYGLLWWARAIARGRLLRRRGYPVACGGGRPTLFVSCFPMIQLDPARRGQHESRFFGPLQAEMRRRGEKSRWIFLWVPYEGMGYSEALELAERLRSPEEEMHFLEEFLTSRGVLRAMGHWLGQARTAWKLESAFPPTFLSEDLALPEAEGLLRSLWRQSFVGNVGAAGLYYFHAFRAMWKRVGAETTLCLHHCEMQAWEKALHSARRLDAPQVRAIAFQHTAVAAFHLFYQYDPEETKRGGMPLADVLACNGRSAYERLAPSGYPAVRIVEALRHLSLGPLLDRPLAAKASPSVFLIAGSIDRVETVSLLRWAREAFPSPRDVELWFKPHPAMPVESFAKEWGRIAPGWPVRRVSGSVPDILAGARWVFVGDSSLSVEALAHGCEVLIPVRSDTPFHNPLGGYASVYRPVYSPAGLRQEVETGQAMGDRREFVRWFWNLDDGLPAWRGLLGWEAAPEVSATGGER